VTDGVTVTLLSASLLQKTSTIMDHLYQITLNQILLCKCEKWCKFSIRIKVKLCKKKLHKMIPACV
jgi:hypothetical protein